VPSWSASAFERITAGEYAISQDHGQLRAVSRGSDLRSRFDAQGVAVTGRTGPAGEIRLALAAWGRGVATPVAAVVPQEGDCASGNAVDAFGGCLRRVHFAYPGVTEWWENRPEGLEQGFTLAAPPRGDGPLVFDVAVSGAAVDVSGTEALLRGESGLLLRYSGVAAWDETGLALPAWILAAPGGLRIAVDDAGALGAVTVDPLLAPAAWQAGGDQGAAYFGSAVASAGDVDGDGFDDVIVGA
jgi:hypothetical protein